MLVRERRQLENALSNLKRGQAYLMAEKRHVCVENTIAMPQDLTFTRASDGAQFASVCKEIGSELALLWEGIRNIEELLLKSQA